MKTHILLSLIFLFGILSGCAEHSSLQVTLDKAETLMEDHPDSAYSLLQTIDSDALRTRGGRARYALLYTQAQDKNYIDETNDSLISLAVDYYRHTDDVRYKFLSYYYKGRMYTNANDYLNATSYYMEAEQWVDAVADDYLVGLLYAELGRIYEIYYDFPKSLEAYQKSAECYERAEKIRHRNYMWLNMGDVCRNLNNYDESERLFSMTLHSAKEINDSTLIRISLGSMVMQCIEQKEMEKAGLLYRELKLYMADRHASSALYGRLAQMYSSTGDFVQAWNCMDKGWSRSSNRSDSISLYFVSSELYDLTGNGKKAYEELKKGVLLQNKEVHQALQQPILTIQRDYLSQELEYQSYKRKMNRLFSLVVVVFVVVLALSLGYILQKRLRRYYRESLHNRLKLQEAENKRKIKLLWNEATQRERSIRQRLEELNQEIQQKDEISINNIRCLQEELNKQGEILIQYKEQHESLLAMNNREIQKQRELGISLLYSYFKTLDKIFVTYYCTDYYSDNLRHTALNDVLTKYLDEYFKCRDKKGYDRLESMVNVYMNNVMVHFRSEVKFTKEEYYQQICFLFAGFSGKFIAYIMDSTPNTIYKRKVEFIKKIKEQEPKHAEIYLSLLAK